jgi:hypothetical protein
MAKPAHSTPPERPEPQPTHALPAGTFTAEELARMDKLAPVDAAAALAWLNGEGPDPWPDGSR